MDGLFRVWRGESRLKMLHRVCCFFAYLNIKKKIVYCNCFLTFSSVSMSLLYFVFGNIRLNSIIALLETFKQGTIVKTMYTDNMFQMSTPAMLEIINQQENLLLVLILLVVVQVVTTLASCLVCSVIKNCSNTDVQLAQTSAIPRGRQYNKWKLARLILFAVTIILLSIVISYAKSSLNFATSEEMRLEIVNLLDIATDKNPSGLTAIEIDQCCCGIVSAKNKPHFGDNKWCDRKLGTCTKAVLDNVSQTTIFLMVVIGFASVEILIAVGILSYTFGKARGACCQNSADGEQVAQERAPLAPVPNPFEFNSDSSYKSALEELAPAEIFVLLPVGRPVNTAQFGY